MWWWSSRSRVLIFSLLRSRLWCCVQGFSKQQSFHGKAEASMILQLASFFACWSVPISRILYLYIRIVVQHWTVVLSHDRYFALRCQMSPHKKKSLLAELDKTTTRITFLGIYDTLWPKALFCRKFPIRESTVFLSIPVVLMGKFIFITKIEFYHSVYLELELE